MSYDINVITPNKKHLANIIKAIAEDIGISSNQTVTVQMHVEFNKKRKNGDC